MKKSEKAITRRDFLRAGTSAMAVGIMGLPLIEGRSRASETKSRVVLVRDKHVLDKNERIQPDVLQKMVDQGVQALTGADSAAGAWRRLVSQKDVVGVKSNHWSRLPTPEALERIIEERLVESGVEKDNISVDDRGVRTNKVFLNSTALINARPMRAHDWSGLGTLLKNYIMFAPRPSYYHDNACENLGAIWRFTEIDGKTRLNILVMLTPLFHGTGPHSFSPEFIWPYCGLIFSRDPVAADATGARIIQAKRLKHFGKNRPISPPPHHIRAAEKKFQLGNSDPARIETVKLGWEEDILI